MQSACGTTYLVNMNKFTSVRKLGKKIYDEINRDLIGSWMLSVKKQHETVLKFYTSVH